MIFILFHDAHIRTEAVDDQIQTVLPASQQGCDGLPREHEQFVLGILVGFLLLVQLSRLIRKNTDIAHTVQTVVDETGMMCTGRDEIRSCVIVDNAAGLDDVQLLPARLQFLLHIVFKIHKGNLLPVADGFGTQRDIAEKLLVAALAGIGAVHLFLVASLLVGAQFIQKLPDETVTLSTGDEMVCMDGIGHHEHFRFLKTASGQVVAPSLGLVVADLIAVVPQHLDVGIDRTPVQTQSAGGFHQIDDIAGGEEVVFITVLPEDVQNQQNAFFLVHSITGFIIAVQNV